MYMAKEKNKKEINDYQSRSNITKCVILLFQIKRADFALISCNLIGQELSNRDVNEVIYPCFGALG